MAKEEAEEKTKTPRRTSSKYDFVKVKVWIGENSDHYYVLSRFLVSRMLTVTKISNVVAIKIALELKKLLVDNSLLDVSQADLEANLFKLMQKRGYGEEYVNRYKMMTNFHHQRVPLLVLVGGTACVGKSTVATQLAQRLNLPNVLQTDIIYELLRTDPNNAAPLNATPLWARTDLTTTEDLMQEFRRECQVIRKGVDGDLTKTMSDGKPLIMEGLHLDPGIYLTELPQARIRNPSPPKHERVHPSDAFALSPGSESPENSRSPVAGVSNETGQSPGAMKSRKEMLTSHSDLLTSRSEKARRRASVHCADPDGFAITDDRKRRPSKGKLRAGSLAEAKEFLRSLAGGGEGGRNWPGRKEGGAKSRVKRSASSCHVAGDWETSPRGLGGSTTPGASQGAGSGAVSSFPLRETESADGNAHNGDKKHGVGAGPFGGSPQELDTEGRSWGMREGLGRVGVTGSAPVSKISSDEKPTHREPVRTGGSDTASVPSENFEPSGARRLVSEGDPSERSGFGVGPFEPFQLKGDNSERSESIAVPSKASELGVSTSERADPAASPSKTSSAAKQRRSEKPENGNQRPSERLQNGNQGPSERLQNGNQEPFGRSVNGNQRLSEQSENGNEEGRREDPIVVQIVLRMSIEDHSALLDEWLASRGGEVGGDVRLDKAAVLHKLRTIQDYLCSFEGQGVAVVDVSTTSFAQTLDWLHTYLLKCIEDGGSGAEGS